MRFPPSFLEDIRARLPVSEVVRHRVKLRKSGREWVGLSPFGSEKTPSFFVNDQKMAWFDFSSGKNGNIFDFVMETEGLTFPETVERLAQDAGLPLPARSVETERQEQKRAGLQEVLEMAAAFFQAELRGSRGGKARAYLDGRGITQTSRTEFRMGYAPAERFALRDALAAKGASVETMCEAGLLNHGEEIAVPYDKFRDRVIFPIADRGGRVIAFGGRALEKDVQAKYLNSPETSVFHKGRVLFNHHRARKAAHDKGRVIAVEGYVDVVAMHAAGFVETVAGMGTALTEEQLALLWQMSPEPVLCFDGDKAGRKAAFRAADLVLPLIGPGKTLAFALLADGQDPDELIRSRGAAAIDEVLAGAMPLVDLIWTREIEGHPLATPEQRAALERDLAAIASSIRDESLRRHYRAEFDQRLQALFGIAAPSHGGGHGGGGQGGGGQGGGGQGGYDRARRGGGPQRRGAFRNGGFAQERVGYLSAPIAASSSLTQSAAFRPGHAGLPPREAMIMMILIAQPALIADHAEELAGLDFSSRDLVPLRDALLDRSHDGIGSSLGLRADLGEAGFLQVVAKIDASGAGSAWYSRPDASPQDAATVLRQALTLHHKTRALHKELLSAETALATDASEANMARMRDIQDQLGALSGTEAALEGFGTSSGRSNTTL
jgi:DNA primase